MIKNYKRSSIILALLAVAILTSCKGADETDKANKLVEEGNAAVQEAQKYVTQAEELKQQMLGKNTAQMTEAQGLARQAVAAYGQAAEKCKLAAAKYDEASKLKLNDKFKQYLAIKAKEYNKRAELVETAKDLPQALVDSTDHAAFVSRANATNEKVNKIGKEAEDFMVQADKLQKENPNMFKP